MMGHKIYNGEIRLVIPLSSLLPFISGALVLTVTKALGEVVGCCNGAEQTSSAVPGHLTKLDWSRARANLQWVRAG